MNYALAPGVSFCRVSGRLLFLDINRDRYFCLAPPADDAFGRWADGLVLTAAELARLDRLADGGPLCRSSVARLPTSPLSPPADGSVLDPPLPKVGLAAVASAATHLIGSAVRLRIQGLGPLLCATARRKDAVARLERPAEARLARVAAAFVRLSAVSAAHDRCLVRSVAVARHLMALGIRPDLVIGVRLQPFKAHCWVQHGGKVVNDHVEIVRPFTPILIL